MWKPKFMKSKTAAPKTEAEKRAAERDIAQQGAGAVVNFARDHLNSLQTTIKDHERLGEIIQKTEEELKQLGAQIETQDAQLATVKTQVAGKFDSLAATFTALCKKVKEGNLPTTALATDETKPAEALQLMSMKKSEPPAQPKVAGA